MKKDKKSPFSAFAIVSIAIFIIISILHMLTERSAHLADKLNNGVCQLFRRFTASIGNLVPFSLFELVLILLPLILFFVIRKAVMVFKSGEGRIRFIANLLSVVLLIYSGHLFALGIAHNTTDIGRKMQLRETKVTAEELCEVMTLIRDEINEIAPTLSRNEKQVYVCEDSFDEISKKICVSYENLTKKYDLPPNFNSRAKEIYFGNVMSYLGTTGIYTYPTGEANVNSYFPSYDKIFTAAHEMSHQRGILRENEANFVAFLITSTSDDPGLRYSGLLNIYSYIGSALYKTDKQAYSEINRGLSSLARADLACSYEIIDKYDDTIFDRISERINDMYLKSSGSSDGVISYSRVVKLVIAYYNTEK